MVAAPLRPALALSFTAALAAAVAARAQEGAPSTPPAPATASEPLNPHVLAVVADYPVDGSFGYFWPRSGGWEGATQDVVYAGRRLARGDAERRSYCCGLTFEVYVRALLRASGGTPVAGIGPDDLHELRLRFFGDSKAGERKRLVQFGLESLGLGRAVSHDEARHGDFVQLWRTNGSGHQAVFVNWLWKGKERVGLTYWSSQPSTRGIGYRSETFAEGVDPEQVYVGRAYSGRVE